MAKHLKKAKYPYITSRTVVQNERAEAIRSAATKNIVATINQMIDHDLINGSKSATSVYISASDHPDLERGDLDILVNQAFEYCNAAEWTASLHRVVGGWIIVIDE